MLNTCKFLMDEMSGQFYAVYGNSYQKMSTKPMLQQAWATGELIDELAATRQAFRYTGLAGSTPPLATGTQPIASTSQQPDDLLPRQPTPKTVQYQPPSFRLTRPTTHLTKNERIQVTYPKPHLTLNQHRQMIAEILRLRVHYPMGREHQLHQPALQMPHPHKHHPRHLQHHINHNSLQTHNTPHQAHTNNI